MSGSNRVTAVSTSPDSFDDADDDDDAGDALPAASISLTNDDGFSRPLIQNEFDAAVFLQSERLSVRGPPDRDLPAWTAGESQRQRRNSSDDDVDEDDDDDDGVDKWAATASSRDSFDDVRLEHPSLLAPSHLGHSDHTYSVDRNMSDHTSGALAWTAGKSHSHRRNSTEDDIDENSDDDDDDDDAGPGELLRRSSAASGRDQNGILILSEFDKPFSFASTGHSLRAPPQ